MKHEPVLLEEVVRLLAPSAGGRYIDGTAGSGGHAGALLEITAGKAWVLALDRDEEALRRTADRLERWPGRYLLEHANYAEMEMAAAKHGWTSVDGVLLDLGVSSDQLDIPSRGFSFRSEGPLDMRMNRQSALTAAEIVNQWPESRLADLLHELGEERKARRVAAAIVRARERQAIRTTGELAGIVESALGGRREKIHPATRTFQALRIAVNDELGSLRRGLDAALSLVHCGGRVAVISFHSLEDRIVKNFARRHEGRQESLPQGGAKWQGELPPVRRITRKPVTATPEEVKKNPRARSAKLRVFERVAQPDAA